MAQVEGRQAARPQVRATARERQEPLVTQGFQVEHCQGQHGLTPHARFPSRPRVSRRVGRPRTDDDGGSDEELRGGVHSCTGPGLTLFPMIAETRSLFSLPGCGGVLFGVCRPLATRVSLDAPFSLSLAPSPFVCRCCTKQCRTKRVRLSYFNRRRSLFFFCLSRG